MNIEIKKSIKPINYNFAIGIMEKRLEEISVNKKKELIWILEHEEIYTGGTNYKDNEILDKSINFIKTNRGGKITYHGPGQLICYFVIDLKKRKKDIRKFVNIIEKTVILFLKEYNIEARTFPDRIGIWVIKNKKIKFKSSAVLTALRYLNTFWKVLFIFYIIPYPIRDFFYTMIAKIRYNIFGKQKSCMLPSENLKSKFLSS